MSVSIIRREESYNQIEVNKNEEISPVMFVYDPVHIGHLSLQPHPQPLPQPTILTIFQPCGKKPKSKFIRAEGCGEIKTGIPYGKSFPNAFHTKL